MFPSSFQWDAERDIKDVGLRGVEVYPKKSAALPQGKLSHQVKTGIIFITYSLLVAKAKKGETRLDQIVKWLEGDAMGSLIIFDECVCAGTGGVFP